MMTCIYCLQREGVYGRRCLPCHAYLDGLRTSDDPRDRDYCAQLITLAVDRYMRRAVGTSPRVTLLPPTAMNHWLIAKAAVICGDTGCSVPVSVMGGPGSVERVVVHGPDRLALDVRALSGGMIARDHLRPWLDTLHGREAA